MKKVISAVLTAAMVVGMGVSVLAATPSKTVADEVKASGSATDDYRCYCNAGL